MGRVNNYIWGSFIFEFSATLCLTRPRHSYYSNTGMSINLCLVQPCFLFYFFIFLPERFWFVFQLNCTEEILKWVVLVWFFCISKTWHFNKEVYTFYIYANLLHFYKSQSILPNTSSIRPGKIITFYFRQNVYV